MERKMSVERRKEEKVSKERRWGMRDGRGEKAVQRVKKKKKKKKKKLRWSSAGSITTAAGGDDLLKATRSQPLGPKRGTTFLIFRSLPFLSFGSL